MFHEEGQQLIREAIATLIHAHHADKTIMVTDLPGNLLRIETVDGKKRLGLIIELLEPRQCCKECYTEDLTNMRDEILEALHEAGLINLGDES